MSTTIRLDIGCGKRPLEGWKGFDIVPFDGVTKYDMRNEQLPFKNDQVEAIRCINTLEHIERKYYRFIFNEWYRVLRVDAPLEFIVPNMAKDVEHAWGDITHVTPWVKSTIMYLTGERPRYASYGFLPWKVLKCEDYEPEPRDLHVILTPRTDRKTGRKYAI